MPGEALAPSAEPKEASKTGSNVLRHLLFVLSIGHMVFEIGCFLTKLSGAHFRRSYG